MTKAPTQHWRHDDLASDLARRLRTDGKVWTWLNATLGTWSGPRPDIMAFPRWRYDIPQIHAYEIKVSRADLLSDLRKEKWRSYLEHCQSVTFAMPHGVATKNELPIECGVMFRTSRGWRTERRATNLGSPCSVTAMAKLLTCHPSLERRTGVFVWDSQTRQDYCRRRFEAAAGARFGTALAQLAGNIAEGKDPTVKAKQQADELIEAARVEAERIRKELLPVLEALGIETSTDAWRRDPWSIAALIRTAAADLSADSRVARAEAALVKVRNALDAALPMIATPPVDVKYPTAVRSGSLGGSPK